MPNYKVEILPVGKTVLGEGPHWDEKRQELYYVDIFEKSVISYNPRTLQENKIAIGGDDNVSLVIPVENQPNKFVLGSGRHLKTLEWDGRSGSQGRVETIFTANSDKVTLNDGKCDSSGRLWFGSMAKKIDLSGNTENEVLGEIYKLDNNGKVSSEADKICIANGLAWSPDNRLFYYIDTWSYKVDVFDYDHAAGTIKNQRPVYDMKANNDGFPDGMCIDANGNLWVASFGSSKVVHIDPKIGKVIDYVHLPARNITSVAFGGPNLDILYATSATFKLPGQEDGGTEAGSTFQINYPGVKGLSAGIPYSGNL